MIIEIYHGPGFLSHTTVSLIFAGTVLLFLFVLIKYAKRMKVVFFTQPQAIANVEKGCVYFKGITQPLTEVTVTPLSKIPCIWYRITISKRQSQLQGQNVFTLNGQGETSNSTSNRVNSGANQFQRKTMIVYSSESPGFLLKDDTASCVVFPEGKAELFVRSKTWSQRNLDQYRQDLPMLNAPNLLLNKYTITEEYIIKDEEASVYGHLTRIALNNQVNNQGINVAEEKKALTRALNDSFILSAITHYAKVDNETLVDQFEQSKVAKEKLHQELKSIFGDEAKAVKFTSTINYPAAIVTTRRIKFYLSTVFTVGLISLAIMVFGSIFIQSL